MEAGVWVVGVLGAVNVVFGQWHVGVWVVGASVWGAMGCWWGKVLCLARGDRPSGMVCVCGVCEGVGCCVY